jgi:hypothetical protein
VNGRLVGQEANIAVAVLTQCPDVRRHTLTGDHGVMQTDVTFLVALPMRLLSER